MAQNISFFIYSQKLISSLTDFDRFEQTLIALNQEFSSFKFRTFKLTQIN
jgi:hypothetical protein